MSVRDAIAIAIITKIRSLFCSIEIVGTKEKDRGSPGIEIAAFLVTKEDTRF
ncbi:MAG: hypothetical protein F6K35_50665 [Okeania sp. SIO2H7]|nr:hypothetical protein [Okeania sp. SIO2H7]